MRLDFVRRPVHDVHASAVRLPSRNTRREMFVGIRDAAIVFFLKLVFDGVGRGIAALPEGLDKLVAFLIVRQLLECGTLLVRDDPAYVFVQPLFVRARHFLLEALFVGFLFLIVQRALERVDLTGLVTGTRRRLISILGLI